MTNQLITLEQVTADINAAIPALAAEMGMTREEFVAQFYKEYNEIIEEMNAEEAENG